jgi:hypothetical protein
LVQSINWLSTIQLKGLYLLDVAKVRRGWNFLGRNFENFEI